MSQTRLRLTPRTDMWRAWVGFNYSHGLGLMVLGGLVLLSGSSELLFATGAAILVPFAFFALTLMAGRKFTKNPLRPRATRARKV